MDAKKRREKIIEILNAAPGPLTGTWLAKELNVSRQIIVGDFAILRAAGMEVYATPQGYILPHGETKAAVRTVIACKHEREGLAEELQIIVDHGGKVLDVSVEHPVYGELTAKLRLSSRRDIAEFLQRVDSSQAQQLASLTGGVHLHTVEAADRETLQRIETELRQRGILLK